MALSATLYTFDIALQHVDRGIYESLVVKAACHPSETEDYLLTRLLAYCLEYDEGIAFSKGGVSDPDDPPVVVRDLTGAWKRWIEIGAPDAARLHKAAKASPGVAVYTHRDPRIVLRQYEGQRIHRAEHLEFYEVDRDLLRALGEHLDRRLSLALTVTDATVYVDLAGHALSGAITRHPLPA